jgi:hypothetical protein
MADERDEGQLVAVDTPIHSDLKVFSASSKKSMRTLVSRYIREGLKRDKRRNSKKATA